MRHISLHWSLVVMFTCSPVCRAADGPSQETVAGWLRQQEQLVRTMVCEFASQHTATQPAMVERLKELDRQGKLSPGPRGANIPGSNYKVFVLSEEAAKLRSFRAKAWYQGVQERVDHYQFADDAAKEPYLIRAFDGKVVRTLNLAEGRRSAYISNLSNSLINVMPRMDPCTLLYRDCHGQTWSEFVARGDKFAATTFTRDGRRFHRITVRKPTGGSLFALMVFDQDRRLVERRIVFDSSAPPADLETRFHFRFQFENYRPHPGPNGTTIWIPYWIACQTHHSAMPDGSPIIQRSETLQIHRSTFNGTIPEGQFVPDMSWSFREPDPVQQTIPRGGAGPEEKPTHVDLHGDSLPPGAVTRLGTTRLRHGQAVEGVAFSPDGKLLASCAGDKVIRLWDTATGKAVRRLHGHQEAIRTLVFTPDGTRLVSAGGPSGTTTPSSKHPELDIVLDNAIRLWDVATGRELRRFTGHQLGVHSASLSPNGKWLVSAGFDYNVCVWELETGKLLRRLEVPNGSVEFARFAPDGRTVALGRSNEIAFWNPHTGEMEPPIEGARGPADSSPDGTLLVAYKLRQAGNARKWVSHLWDVQTRQPIRELEFPGGQVSSYCFTPDGKTIISPMFAAGQQAPALVCWDAATGKLTRHLQNHPLGSSYRTPAVSRDGSRAAAGTANRVGVWDLATGKELHMPGNLTGWPYSVAWSPDGKTLATGNWSKNQNVQLWNAASGELLRTLEQTGNAESVAFAPNGKTLAIAQLTGRPGLWDVTTGKPIRAYDGAGSRWDLITFAADGKTLSSGGWYNRQAHVWEVATGKLLRTFTRNSGRGLAYSPCGRLLAMTDREGDRFLVRVWNTTTGKEWTVLTGFDGPLQYLAFSPDGRTLASVGAESTSHFSHGGTYDPKVRLWELLTGKERTAFANSPRGSWSVTFAPSGRILATAGEDTMIRLWDLAADRECRRLEGHAGAVTAVAFAPEGKRLASSSTDATVLVWDVTAQTNPPATQAAPSPEQLDALWADLGDEDARKAYRAHWSLVAVPRQAVRLLRERLRPTSSEVPESLLRRIADLDSERPATRQQASESLEKAGHQAELALRRALATNLPLESRTRIEKLLEKLDHPVVLPERLQALRALEVLEQMGTPDAHAALARLAAGAPEARQTREARAAMDRVAPPNAPKP